MNYTDLSVQKRLVTSKEAINAVLDDQELSETLAKKGYPAEELAVGLSLQDNALKLYQTRIVEYGTGINTTGVLSELTRSTRGFVVAHRNIARTALKDASGLLDKLRLRQPLSKQRDVFLLQVRHFYTEIVELPEILDKVTPYGVTADVVAALLEQVGVLESAMNAQQQKRAEARALRVKRDAAIAALDDWTVEFLGTYRLVFRKQPDQLRKLGV